ncbi:extracellular matrix organizing protein FRAS1-like [Poecile atricapillus]|uniref:extracellular matrix organizing protein FRAS1-like n=1 Tax=Poecile atricapillus TaxID=48891 RepID=UPI00273864BC|nr:extracellular matrix organizing protein FRAS1-like [Poecile atricapillus]
MEFSFFYDTVLWRTGIQTDSVLSARLQIIPIYIREDGRLVSEFRTQAKFRGEGSDPGRDTEQGHTELCSDGTGSGTSPCPCREPLWPCEVGPLRALPPVTSLSSPSALLWSAQTFDSPYQLWRATSSYNRKDYSGEYTMFPIPCTVQPTQPWAEPGAKPLPCTAHAPERFLILITFQQTSRPVPVVYSQNTRVSDL